MRNTTRRGLFAASLAFCSLLAGVAAAQTYPNRPIRVLEPLAAGSSIDVITRIVTDKMGQILDAKAKLLHDANIHAE